MKKVNEKDTLRPEYNMDDLGVGVRGKYYDPKSVGSIMVKLKPEVAAAFPTEKSANDALLFLIKIAQNSINPAKKPTRKRM